MSFPHLPHAEAHAPSLSELAARSPTLSHLQRYHTRATDAVVRVLPLTWIASVTSLLVAVLATAKRYAVDSPASPAFLKLAYERALAGASALDHAFSTLVLRDGVDAFVELYAQHGGALGPWAMYFAVDFTAHVSNTLITGLVLRPLRLTHGVSAAAAASPDAGTPPASGGSVGSAGSEMPHLRELTNTTNALRRDLSTRYLDPAKTMIETQYIQPLNEKVESTKTLLNSTYDGLVRPTYAAAVEAVSKTYEDNLESHDSLGRALVSTGVDLGSRTLEKIKAVTLTAEALASAGSTSERTAVDVGAESANGLNGRTHVVDENKAPVE